MRKNDPNHGAAVRWLQCYQSDARRGPVQLDTAACSHNMALTGRPSPVDCQIRSVESGASTGDSYTHGFASTTRPLIMAEQTQTS